MTQPRETTRAERLHAVMDRLGQAVMKLDHRSLSEVCESWGVRPPHKWPEGGGVAITQWDSSEVSDRESLVELAEAKGVDLIEMSGQIPDGSAAPSNVEPDKMPDGEIGTPGTQIHSGILRNDPNPRMSPYLARGFAGSFGVYESHLREGLVYKAVQSIREQLVSGDWDIKLDKKLVKKLDEDTLERVQAAADEVWHAIQHCEGGWEEYLEHAATNVIFGFSIFEIVWEAKGERMLPKKLAFREPNTVQYWLMDDKQRDLEAVQFQTGGSASMSYVLPSKGERVQDHRVLINSLARRGNNFEGMPPLRVIDTLIVKKHLLLVIQAACAERFGAPLLVAKTDVAALKDLTGVDPDKDEWEELFDILSALQARDTTALSVPTGLMVEYLNPEGTPPTFQDQLEYIDSQIQLAFSTQGTGLGQNSHGSYALAEVQQDDFNNSIPYYARTITRHLNELVRLILTKEYGLELPGYPRIEWSSSTTEDVSRWLSDASSVIQAPLEQWPEKARAIALEKLGLPPDTFVVEDGDELEQTTDPQLIYKITNAMGAGLIARTPENIRAAHAFLNLPEPSDEQIAELLATVPGEPPTPVANAEHAPGCSCCGPVSSVEVGDSLIACAEFDADVGAEIMDRAEQQLAKRFKSLGRELAERWKVLIRDNKAPDDVLADRETIRDEFLSRYQEAVIDAVEMVGKGAGEQLLRELGLEVAAPFERTTALDLLTVSVSEEALNRSLGVATDAQVARERGDKRLTIPVLAASTLALIASRVVSTAFNAARTQLIEGLRERFATKTGRSMRIWAERSSVLDERTCETCRELDGKRVLVESREYYNLMPPNKCKGGHRCRCVYRYSVDVATLEKEGVI